MLTMKYYEAAGRAAYLAGFHAAQALISERTGRTAKTYRGVGTEFHRLLRGDARISQELRDFLGFAYNLKTVADYDIGSEPGVSPELATDAVATAKRFVAKLSDIIENDAIPTQPVV